MAIQKSTIKTSSYSDAPTIGDAIKALRVNLGISQRALARMIGVTQGAVNQWEGNKAKPSPMALMALGRLAFDEKGWWFAQAGEKYEQVEALIDSYKKEHMVDADSHKTIKLYRSAGIGPNRFTQDAVTDLIAVPRSWFGESQTIVGLYAKGEAMAPMIEDGFIVLVDIFDNKDLKALTGKVVAARLDEGVSVRWLKRKGNAFSLVSHHDSMKHPPIEVEPGGYAIVGRVVRWIGCGA